jgi:hypothetical protein
MTKVEQVSIDGTVIAVSPKRHGKGSEGDYSDNDAVLMAAARVAEIVRQRALLAEIERNAEELSTRFT